MILALVGLAAHSQFNTDSIAQFFPLAEDARWVYQDSNGGGRTITWTVRAPIDDFRSDATNQKDPYAQRYFPIDVATEGGGTSTPCYAILNNVVYLVALKPREMILKRPILMIGPGEKTWDYLGDPVGPDQIPLETKCKSKPGPMQELLGEKRATYILDAESTYTIGRGKKPLIDVVQHSVYADGLGLFSMTTKGNVNGQPVDSEMKLVAYSAGKPVGVTTKTDGGSH